MTADPTPVTDLAGKEVYTADAVRIGRVVDVVVDLLESKPVALALADVTEDAVGPLPDGAAGVRVPMPLVRGVGDVVVLRATAREAAFPLPGETADGTEGSGESWVGGEPTPAGAAGGPSGTADGGAAGDRDPVHPVDDGPAAPGSAGTVGDPGEDTDGDRPEDDRSDGDPII